MSLADDNNESEEVSGESEGAQSEQKKNRMVLSGSTLLKGYELSTVWMKVVPTKIL